GKRRKGARGDRVRARHGDDRLARHGHARVDHGRLRSADVHALDRRPGMENEARHHVTFSAPWLMSVMPVRLMVAAAISTFGATSEMPVWVMVTIEPPTRSMMPPAGPGTSLITMQFCPAVCSTMLGETGNPANAIVGMSAALPQRQPT